MNNCENAAVAVENKKKEVVLLPWYFMHENEIAALAIGKGQGVSHYSLIIVDSKNPDSESKKYQTCGAEEDAEFVWKFIKEDACDVWTQIAESEIEEDVLQQIKDILLIYNNAI